MHHQTRYGVIAFCIPTAGLPVGLSRWHDGGQLHDCQLRPGRLKRQTVCRSPDVERQTICFDHARARPGPAPAPVPVHGPAPDSALAVVLGPGLDLGELARLWV